MNDQLEHRIKRARIYPRVSSEEQQEKETIQNQTDFAQKYCDLYKIEIVDWYPDDGISGTIPLEERPEGKRLLADLRADSEPCIVLIFNVKRLGRGARIILNAVYDLEQTGATVKSMTEPFDTETPFGRFMLTILAGEAAFDRESFLYNMWLGMNRWAAKGRWLGGIVPYGYRVVDKYLVVNEDPIPGFDRSEADIIRMIYYLVADLRQSTIQVADYLNLLHVPTSYIKDERLVQRGKRKVATSGLWTPARVRNIIVNPTYKGVHYYGKRSKKQRELIERAVPRIVFDEQWDRAQEVLRDNQIEAMRNSKRQYLLRGLIRCGQCGLTYIGTANYGKNRKLVPCYRCNGKQSYRGKMLGGCQSKNIPSEWIEKIVWDDCVNFIMNPGDAVKEIAAGMEQTLNQIDLFEKEKMLLLKTIGEKESERQKILDLYRKAMIDFKEVEDQLTKIATEKESLNHRLRELTATIEAENLSIEQVNTVEELLNKMRDSIQGDVSFEDKRRIVKYLVKGIKVDTVFDEQNQPEAKVSVTYYFDKDVKCTDNHAKNKSNVAIIREIKFPPQKCLESLTTPGQRIRSARWAKNMTLRQLAAASGMSEAGVNYLELKTPCPSLATLNKFSGILEKPIWWLGYFEELPEETVGQKLKKARMYRGLTHQQAADLIGTDPRIFADWEKDIHRPSEKFRARLDQFLDVLAESRVAL